MLIDHQGCHEEEGKHRQDQTQNEAFSAGNERLRIQFIPIDIVPVEGPLKDPVLKLQFRLLRHWKLGLVNGDLAANLDEFLDVV